MRPFDVMLVKDLPLKMGSRNARDFIVPTSPVRASPG
jgi:hypothetical protein